MIALIHRYIRRLILWAQKPSDEEVRQERIAEQRARTAGSEIGQTFWPQKLSDLTGYRQDR